MQRSRGVTIYSISLIVYGVYTLLGASNYGQFSKMFMTLPRLVIMAVFVFSVLYGICCIYCGHRMMKLEEWARKTMVFMTAISVFSGIFLFRTATSNIRHMLYSGQLEVPAGSADVAYKSIILLTVLFTLYEISVIFFFTRGEVKKQFS